jgi:hypothetical protein
MQKITSLVKSLQPNPVRRKARALVRLALSDPRRALTVLKRKVSA